MRAEHLRIAERSLGGEMFLERDLALHEVSSRDFPGIMQCHGGGCQQRGVKIKKAAPAGGN